MQPLQELVLNQEQANRFHRISSSVAVSCFASVEGISELNLTKKEKAVAIRYIKRTVIGRFRSHVCEILGEY